MIHTAITKAAPRLTVAAYITAQINLCGKSQMEIAEECGFPKANMITMIKQGKTKLPTAKIGLMATALGVDPMYLYKLAMEEYEPENWAAIQESVIKQPLLTENEKEIIETIRKAKMVDPKLRTKEDKTNLINFIKSLKAS